MVHRKRKSATAHAVADILLGGETNKEEKHALCYITCKKNPKITDNLLTLYMKKTILF